MTSFILAPENLPFTISLGFMFAIGLLEGITTLFGSSASGHLDSMVPEADIDVDVHVDINADIEASNILTWMNVGKVPILILLVLFLFSFGAGGLIIQSISQNMLGKLSASWLASIPAFILGILFVRVIGNALSKVIPKDETQAVSEKSFIGRVALITLGTAKRGQPAQAKLCDQHNQTHYILVEPENDEDILETGSHVFLVRQTGAKFFVTETSKQIS
ncbi:MAG: YqiJ family protein [Desulfobacterales bacterium]|nr:YqiJ family protein [Desulfobacterales bacterium]